MQMSIIDMKTLAISVFRDLTSLDTPKNIDFRVGRLPSTSGDPKLIPQVWINLLANAIKFSSRREQAIIEIGSMAGKGETIYFVRDNGAGFDPRYANKLFGVFQRLHNESDFPGTGVGLAIVQRIIHRHSGRVWAESQVNQGATFFFSLPNKNP
jgi:light-regulated signal transduction histidine kinase (bacteriophytochrome)